MGKVLKAADSGENALLESPTGSGKSLALLCSGTPPRPRFLAPHLSRTSRTFPSPSPRRALTPTPTVSIRARFPSALAWQERWKATHGVGGAGVKVDDEGWIEDADPCSAPASSAPASSAGDKENVVSPDAAPAAAPAATRKPPKVPRIYYATRTHSQIAQVVKELKRTAYRPSMVVLGSREHYCINKSVRARKGRNLGEECKALLEGGARRAGRENADETGGGGGGGCGYSHGALKLAGAAQRPGSSPVDIEDLVKLGGKTRGCPYFAAKHMSETAELIFCPYNYLLDPSVRAAMDVDVKGALVILDEAHNVEDTAREAASCDVKLSDVVAAAEEFRRVADDERGDRDRDSNPSGNALLASVLEGVARWLGGASDLSHPRCPLRADGFERWMAVWSDGARVAQQMRDMGLDPERLASMEDARKAAVKEANDSKTPPARRVGGAALKTAEMLFTSARYASGGGGGGGFGGGGGAHDFRLVVQRTLAESAAGGGFGDDDERSATTTLSLWALNPALAFGDLAGPGGARAVVLTSGTLAPLNSFASELGVPFPIRMEAPHCVDMNTQVWAGAVATGPGGAKLNGTFKTASEFAYQDDLGAALASWCEDVPHGVLVFFPSYSMLDRVAKRWRTTGLWRRLEQNAGKRIFQEPRGNEPSRDANGPGGRGGGRGRGGGGRGRGGASAGGRENALDALLSKYYRAVKSSVSAAPHPHAAAPPGSASRGAVLLAVCRGKVSEGIDFADANARAVVIVGIPYPNVKDKQVELKRQYNNEGARRGLLSGDQWYSQQAFRALNQAVGRCLRHRSDHGVIILADDRYAHGAGGDLCRHLPKWLRPATRKCASFEDSKRGIRAFFDARAADPPPTRVEPETLALPPSVRDASKSKQGRDAAAANASNRTRKPREKERAAAEDGDEESNARGVQRDIKNFFAPVGAATGGGGGTDAGATDNGASFGRGLGHGSFAANSGPHPHQLPLEIAEEREMRRGWTPAAPPPPLESDPRVTSQLTDPPTAPPTQDARTMSTLTEPNDTATVTETETTVTATTAVERVMERMEREFERRRGTATESAAPVETERMPPPPPPPPPPPQPSAPSAPVSSVPPPIMGRAGDTSGTPRAGTSTSPRAATQPTPGSARGGGWGGVEEDATGWGGTPATQATPGAGWVGWGATQQFRDPVPERAPPVAPTPTPPRRAPPPEPEKTTEDVDGEEALDASGGTQPEEPEEPEEPEPARVCEPARCRSCGAEVAPSLASLERRAAGDLTYLATLAEANGDARVSDVDRVALVVPALVAARRLCAAPAPIRPRTDAGDVPPPNWAGDCQGVWVPEDGCYYAPLRCRGRWVGVRVEATDHARRDLAGCTLLLEASLREGEPTPRVEPSKTQKRTTVVDDDEGGAAPEREENERADDDPDAAAAAADPPAEEPARKRRRIRRKASAEAAVGRRGDNGALPRRAARAKPRLPDPDEVVGRSMVKNFGRHGDFVGVVESWDPKRGYYRIVYGDGDEEELEPRELQWFLK